MITGGARGIGRAIATRLADEGASIVVNYLSSESSAAKLVSELRDGGGQAISVRADVTKEKEVQDLVSRSLDHFGKIDVLVNNAGIEQFGEVLSMHTEDLDRVMDVHLKASILTIQSVAPQMIERNYGKILMISSIAGLGTAIRGMSLYALSKAALNMLTKRTALELGPYQINVNAICPGGVRTEMLESAAENSDDFKRIISNAEEVSMLGRIGIPEDIAYTAAFLVSDKANFITAQILTVDGGRKDFLTHSA